jgi:hypothetical protein
MKNISAQDIENEAKILYPLQKSSSDYTLEAVSIASRKAYIKGAKNYANKVSEEREILRKFLIETGNLDLFEKWMPMSV